MDASNQPQGSGQAAPVASSEPQGQPAPNAAPTNNTAPVSQQPQGQAEAPAANLEGANDWEYNGDPNAVPAQFQKFAKGLQRHFTKRSMTEADIRRKGQEYDQLTTSEDFKAYQQWRQGNQQGQPAQAQPQARQAENPSVISAQEWEDAQLDTTGQKAQGLIDRVVQARLSQAVQSYGGQLQQLQAEQQKTQFNTALSDYADANPDVLELHEMGLMKPLLEEEFASRKHQTYESAINAAHQRASQARDGVKSRLLADQQKLVAQKKDAIVTSGTGTGEANVVYVEKQDGFATAFENAINGRKVKNKLK